ncbi:MAG TPA: histidine kinase [Candidatus Binatia bacterium]|nr:histidine kinase [Candidatus Binatia bacterium]
MDVAARQMAASPDQPRTAASARGVGIALTPIGRSSLERTIARGRLALSLAALVALYIEPAQPLLSRWVPLQVGAFALDFRLLAVMGLHLSYSVAVYFGLRTVGTKASADGFAQRFAFLTPVDLLFAVAVGILTEGPTSPAFPFFAFAMLAASLREGLRTALRTTGVSVVLYLAFILLSGTQADDYIMRPAYLAITGYLVGFLGEQRRELQDEVTGLERAEQRHRIARDLHDGLVQALAGINLRLESCRRLLREHADREVLDDLGELQESVQREYDDLRNYTRSLVGRETAQSPDTHATATALTFRADVSGSLYLIEHVLQIAREGLTNVRKHANARTAAVRVQTDNGQIHISIEDDGIGFRADVTPWSINSRVNEIGGRMQIVKKTGRGAQLLITLPQS